MFDAYDHRSTRTQLDQLRSRAGLGGASFACSISPDVDGAVPDAAAEPDLAEWL